MKVVVGQAIAPVELQADAIRLLRFAAATRNAHRIHYDADFARSEGLDGPIVMAQLHGCLFFRAAARFAGSAGAVRAVGWRNRAPAYADDSLVVTGTVRDVDEATGEITLDLEERCRADSVCCQGYAVVVLDDSSAKVECDVPEAGSEGTLSPAT
jgi:hydroxyacyl-ACP dehydratase HTD2-like protein with hotdog domain